MHVKPVLLDCNFIVDSTVGLGIRSLKGPAIQNVFMHTSTTPAVGNSNPASPNVVVTNPNPASGIIIVQFQDNFNRSFLNSASITSPTSGSAVKIDNSAMTAGVPYVITTVGNATTAKWNAIGVPAGVTPAVGVSFIAASNGGTGNTLTSRVMATATAGAGISSVETIGDVNTTIAPNPTASQGFGAQMILQCFGASLTMNSYTPAGTNDSATPPIFTGTPAVLTGTVSRARTAPADGTLISLSFYLSDSSILIQGE